VRDAASEHGVRIAKWLGDGAMIVGVDVEPLVCAVLDIERTLAEVHAPLPLRAGLAAGDVILFEGDDYIGSMVNLAARLCDEAKGHQILATPEVAAHAPPWAGSARQGGLRIRGFAEPVEVVDLGTWSHAAEVVVDPVCGMEVRIADVVRGSFCSENCAAVHDRQAVG
jgi:adenylate cyclase